LIRPRKVDELLARNQMDESPEIQLLFHRLNNQLGIILAHAELLETKASDESDRTRAAQIVSSALDAMTTAREIRRQTGTSGEANPPTERNRNLTANTLTTEAAISSNI
jgi:hypothetical protein